MGDDFCFTEIYCKSVGTSKASTLLPRNPIVPPMIIPHCSRKQPETSGELPERSLSERLQSPGTIAPPPYSIVQENFSVVQAQNLNIALLSSTIRVNFSAFRAKSLGFRVPSSAFQAQSLNVPPRRSDFFSLFAPVARLRG